MLETRVPDSACPVCNTTMNAAGSLESDVPRPGDFTICVGCGSILRFKEDMTLKKAELMDIRKCDKATKKALSKHLLLWAKVRYGLD